ncbi:RCC1 domain-containing protein [Pseudofulvimonas gallinarii]|uniref:RCC1 domain-containing protein n=1 Tax=Pseudofulvimonas gallinarii TaxID=634155 RepID=UPI0035ED010D
MRAISAGGLHTCAVLVAGGVRCWGYNQDGQLGDGSTTLRLTPVNVSGFSSGGRLIASGLFHTCAATSTGAVRCWGQNNAGQLGDTTTTMRTTPVNVEGLSSGVAVLASSHHHTCADRPDGQMRCWGGNGSGQLGDYTTTNRTVPVNVLQRDSIFEHGFEAP